jgi:hypothetical protein
MRREDAGRKHGETGMMQAFNKFADHPGSWKEGRNGGSPRSRGTFRLRLNVQQAKVSPGCLGS